MSFGLIKRFKDIKKTPEGGIKKTFAKHVIVGHDLGAILKLVELRKNNPAEHVRLISNKPLSQKSILEDYQNSVSLLRSEKAVEAIYKKHFNARILPQAADPTFYKDGKFHEFTGRAKSMELLKNEMFFTTKGYEYSVESFFAAEDWNNLDELLKASQDMKIFESVAKTEPTDLVEKQEWLLTFKDFSELGAENLYISTSPNGFLNLISNKNDLDGSLIDFCSSTETIAALNVSFELKKDYGQKSQTLFIPQSMTHEWGHFIVEFPKEKLCNVLFLIHEEEPQAEDLGAKIKLLKRVLERVFPEFENNIKSETIRFDAEMFIEGVRNELLLEVASKYPSLEFLSQSKLVDSSLSSEQYLARILI